MVILLGNEPSDSSSKPYKSRFMFNFVHGTLSVTVAHGFGDKSSNPGQSSLCFTLHWCHWERHESNCSLAMSNIGRQTSFFRLLRKPV